jgi:hypothetical protein
MLSTLVSCGTSYNNNSYAEKLTSFTKLLQLINDDTITAGTGAYSIVKPHTTESNTLIAGYFDDATGLVSYVALDLTNFSVYKSISGMTSAEVLTYIMDNLYIEDVTIANAGAEASFFDGDDTGWIYEETSAPTKDLETMAANLTRNEVAAVEEGLVENYGLSTERASEVAKVTHAFNKIQNKRALTEREMSVYTSKVFGVDYKAGKSAIEKHIQGESTDLETIIDKAADINGVSPEAVSHLLSEVLTK